MYCIIKPPPGIRENGSHPYLVKSEKGVYFASLDRGCNHDKCWLRVWVINESDGQMKWILKHDKDLKPMLAHHCFLQRFPGPWILEDINYNMFLADEDDKKSSGQEKFEWNSDNHDLPGNGDSCSNEKVMLIHIMRLIYSGFTHTKRLYS